MSITKHDSNWSSTEYFRLQYSGCNKSTTLMGSESSWHPHTAPATTLYWALLTSVSGDNKKWGTGWTPSQEKKIMCSESCLSTAYSIKLHHGSPTSCVWNWLKLDYSAFLKSQTNKFLSIYQSAVSGKGLTAKLQKCFYWGQYVLSANSLSSNANILILYCRIGMENGGCSSPLPKAMETGTNRALVKQQD